MLKLGEGNLGVQISLLRLNIMVGRIMLSTFSKCLYPTPGTCAWDSLHDKRDFADVIKVADFEMGKNSCELSGCNTITLLLQTREFSPNVVRRRCDNGRKVREMRCTWVWWWLRAKDCRWPAELETRKKWIISQCFQKEHSSADTHFRAVRPMLEFWTMKIKIFCCFKPLNLW